MIIEIFEISKVSYRLTVTILWPSTIEKIVKETVKNFEDALDDKAMHNINRRIYDVLGVLTAANVMESIHPKEHRINNKKFKINK